MIDLNPNYWLVCNTEHGCRGMCKRSIQDHRNALQGVGGPSDANFFRVNSKRVTVEMVESFRVPDLTEQYLRVSPYLHCILKGVIGKEGKSDIEGVTILMM